jgi:formylglycine-generating enzyme required for sulfatase activity
MRLFQKLQNILRIFLLLFFLHSSTAHAVIFCEWIFGNKVKQSETQTTNHSLQTRKSESIQDLKSFSKAMTEGMLLNPGQADLFEVYRKSFFGDPKTSVDNKTLQSVTDILEKHPELEKPHFREYEIYQVEKIYEAPESLKNYLNSQFKTAGQIRSNLFQIEANLGFWKKVLDFHEDSIPEGITKEQQKKYLILSKLKFEKYLNRMISKTNRDLLSDLKSENEDYQKKAKSLYATLKYIQEWMEKKGRNTQIIRQAMVDLVNTVGYGNQATQVLLKSKNALDNLEGLKKILDERDSIAMDLGYDGHFQELQRSLKIQFPTGYSKNESPFINIQKLEQEVLVGNHTSKATEIIRVRSLSIQEAPFRSCLGGSDCSTRTYFDKALDPNFNYFTLTDSENHSNGHITIVLGTAQNTLTGKNENVAFIDKLQNISNQQIPLFLKAVALSLEDRGYKLGIPESVGNHNGLSNMDTTRHFVNQEILPHLRVVWNKFVPHKNKYAFRNQYSRAYDSLNIKILDEQLWKSLPILRDAQIKSGKQYARSLAPSDLNKNELISGILKLKKSSDSQVLLKYISSYSVIEELEKLNLYSLKDFLKDLIQFVDNKSLDFNVRKQALLNDFIYFNHEFVYLFNRLKVFNVSERIQILSEINQWKNSSNSQKKGCFEILKKFQYEIETPTTSSTGTTNQTKLNVQDFFQKMYQFLDLKKSNNPIDLENYFSQKHLALQLESLGLLKENDYSELLDKTIANKKFNLKLRQSAFSEKIILKIDHISESSTITKLDLSEFTPEEIRQISLEFKSWALSKNPQFIIYFEKISQFWTESIVEGDLQALIGLQQLNLFNINNKNGSGFSPIVLAAFNEQKNIIEWLLHHPDLDLTSRDIHGYNDVEKIRLLGKVEIANLIESQRPESKGRSFEVKERHEDGSPIYSFVKIPSGTFMMGNAVKTKVSITQPIEMMSTLVTQQIWKDVLEFHSLPSGLNKSPSKFSGSSRPVEMVSHSEIETWIEHLNILSKDSNPELQKELSQLFPGHQKEDIYSLPTEAEFEYVARVRGISSGDYLFENKSPKFEEYAWYAINSNGQTHPVGLKKPIFINGHPIYDIQGNVSEWMYYQPRHPLRELDEFPRPGISGSQVPIRGSNYFFSGTQLKNGFHYSFSSGNKYSSVGFRLVRVKSDVNR